MIFYIVPNVLLFVRFSLATVIMAIMFYKYVKDIKLKDLKGGMVTGTCLFLAYLIQTDCDEIDDCTPEKMLF